METLSDMDKRVNLRKLFSPGSVVVIGASRTPGRVGHSVVQNLQTSGYWGRVDGVNANGGEGPGNLHLARSVEELDQVADLAIVCVPSDSVVEAVEACAQIGVGAAVVIASDVGDGGQGDQRASDLLALVDKYGIRILGPNTLGFFVCRGSSGNLLATYVTPRGIDEEPTDVGIIGQGGGLTSYVGIESLAAIGVAPACVIDTGNELDVDTGDCIAFLGSQDQIGVVGLVLESARNGRKLCEAVAASTRMGIRTVVLRLGRTGAGANAASLHTGALAAGNAALWDELEAVGAFVTGDERDFVAALSGLRGTRVPGRTRPRIGVLTWSGGFGVHAADLLAERSIPVAAFTEPPSDEEADALRTASPLNPLDLGGYNPRGSGISSDERLSISLEFVLRQPEVDACLLWEATLLKRSPTFEVHLGICRDAIERHRKPIYLCGGFSPETGIQLREVGVTPFRSPSDLVALLASLAPATPIPKVVVDKMPAFTSPPGPTEAVVRRVGDEAFSILGSAGLRGPDTVAVSEAANMGEVVTAIGLPMVLKLIHPELIHKTEHQGIRIVHTEADAHSAATDLFQVADDLGLFGAEVTAEEFVSGMEIAVGAFVDAELGPTIMVGRGGIEIESERDVTFALAPVTEARAQRMLDQLRCRPMLAGARSSAPYDVDALSKVIASVSNLVDEHKLEYVGIDLNPVMVLAEGKGVVVVDAVIEELVAKDGGRA
jgi:acyl-CoA synthetase (NDP forming)